MSDDERDLDVDSDDGEVDDDDTDSLHALELKGQNMQFATQAEKRAHHNALERKRRDHIKDSFSGLRDSVPALKGDKSSRAQILHKATEYIDVMQQKNDTHQCDIEDLRMQNQRLEQQIRALEKAKATGNYTASIDSIGLGSLDPDLSDSESDSDMSPQQRRKKLKI